MLTQSAYELAMYVIDRLMEEDPPADSPSGEVLRTLAGAVKEYEKFFKPDGTPRIDNCQEV